MTEKFKNKFNNPVMLEISMILLSMTTESYLVGGAVRDILLNQEPKDYDFVVGNIDYDTISEVFQYAGWTTKETGKEFLVLMVTKIINNIRYEFEIALLRKDGMYTNGRRPEGVKTGTILEDAQRRDFSINSLYYDLYNDKIVDPTCKGLKDIQTRTLRFNGSAKKRLEEDYLRLYRALRFLKKYNLRWAQGSERVFNREFIKNSQKVNPQRVLNELNKC